MARRVTGAVIDIEGEVADRHPIAVHQPAVGLEDLAVDAIAAPVVLEATNPEAIVLVRAFQWDTQFLRQRPRLSAMVDMAVRHEDLFDGDAGLSDRVAQFRQVATRIDEGALHGFGAPEQCAILLKRRDGDDRGAQRGLCHEGDMACVSGGDKRRTRCFAGC